jgi:hypothetical protein
MKRALALLLIVGCSKTEAPRARPAAATAPAAVTSAPAAKPSVNMDVIQPGNTDDTPKLAFTITKAYEREQPLDHAPWHASGGEWTFFDAEAQGAHFTVGTFARPIKDPALAGFGGFGEAMIAVPTADDGARLAQAFARGFHVALPPEGAKGSLHVLRFSTAVLGRNVARSAEGGFGGTGTWSAGKWFFNGGDSEVFFNYSAVDGRGEFSEKDADYDKGVAAALAQGLRDGRGNATRK